MQYLTVYTRPVWNWGQEQGNEVTSGNTRNLFKPTSNTRWFMLTASTWKRSGDSWSSFDGSTGTILSCSKNVMFTVMCICGMLNELMIWVSVEATHATITWSGSGVSKPYSGFIEFQSYKYLLSLLDCKWDRCVRVNSLCTFFSNTPPSEVWRLQIYTSAFFDEPWTYILQTCASLKSLQAVSPIQDCVDPYPKRVETNVKPQSGPLQWDWAFQQVFMHVTLFFNWTVPSALGCPNCQINMPCINYRLLDLLYLTLNSCCLILKLDW